MRVAVADAKVSEAQPDARRTIHHPWLHKRSQSPDQTKAFRQDGS
jgi:hypothetical protein